VQSKYLVGFKSVGFKKILFLILVKERLFLEPLVSSKVANREVRTEEFL